MSVLAKIDPVPAASAAIAAISSLPSGAPRASVPQPVAVATPDVAAPAPSNTDAIKAAAAELDAFMRSSNQSIVFQVDKPSGQVIVSIQDATTGQTIRQIPSEVVLRIAQELKQNKTVESLLLDAKA